MAQQHLPSLAALGTGPAVAPTGRKKGSTVRGALLFQEEHLKKLYDTSKGVVLVAADKRRKYDQDREKYSQADRDTVFTTFLVACRRTEELRQMLTALQKELGLEVYDAQEFCASDEAYNEMKQMQAVKKAREANEACEKNLKAKIPMGHEVKPMYQGQIVPRPTRHGWAGGRVTRERE